MTDRIHATIRRSPAFHGGLLPGWTATVHVDGLGTITNRFRDRHDAVLWASRTVMEEQQRRTPWPDRPMTPAERDRHARAILNDPTVPASTRHTLANALHFLHKYGRTTKQ